MHDKRLRVFNTYIAAVGRLKLCPLGTMTGNPSSVPLSRKPDSPGRPIKKGRVRASYSFHLESRRYRTTDVDAGFLRRAFSRLYSPVQFQNRVQPQFKSA